MHREILRIDRPSRRYLEWAIDLATSNMQRYSRSPFLRHSKAKSIRSKANNFIFCIVEDEPVGFITFRFSRDTAYVFELHVEEKYRSLGIGTELLDRCKEMYPGIVKRIVLYVYKENSKGLDFYRRSGFEINEGYNSGRFHEMVFRK